MSQTTHFNLDKRDLTDNIGTTAITTYNSNMDTIDDGLNMISNKNYIINGNFDIWQRGTSFVSAAGVFTADRWRNVVSSVDNISRQTTDGTEPFCANYYMRIERTSATTNNIRYRVENSKIFAGKNMVLTYWAKADSSQTIETRFIVDGNTLSSPSHNATTSWQQFEITATMPTTITGDFIEILLIRNNIVATYDLAQVKLEIGNRATPFTPRTISEELRDCQRYYEKSYNLNVIPGTSSSNPGVNADVIGLNTIPNNQFFSRVDFKVSKIINPTVSVYGFRGTLNTVSNLNTGNDFGSNSGIAINIGENGFGVRNQSGGDLNTSGSGVSFHWVADSEI